MDTPHDPNGQITAHEVEQILRDTPGAMFGATIMMKIAALIESNRVEYHAIRAVLRKHHLIREFDAELKRLQQAQQAASPTARYRINEQGGISYVKPTSDGSVAEVALTNFTARIVAEISEDDGAEVVRSFEIDVVRNRSSTLVHLPAKDYQEMSWVIAQLGGAAIINPGYGLKDHTRAAIQYLSGDIPQRTVYKHTGWRLIEGKPYYLHAGGAIGPDGHRTDIKADLSGPLKRFSLPEVDPQRLAQDVRESLDILDVIHNDSVVMPIYVAVWRAPLGHHTCSLHLHGLSGEGKTEFAMLIQSHYGSEFRQEGPPANWSSTDNALEMQAFTVKDAVLLIDEFVPPLGMSPRAVEDLHRKAERIFRAAANGTGRNRLRWDLTMQPERPPRGLILSTGEELPQGMSLSARVWQVEIPIGSMHWDQLTRLQQCAREGVYARAMAGYLGWLARMIDDVITHLPHEIEGLRRELGDLGTHKRTPDAAANLLVGMKYFLRFAQATGAIDGDEASALSYRCMHALISGADHQRQHQEDHDVAERYITLIRNAMVMGRAHIVALDDDYGVPINPEMWGWRVYRYKDQDGQQDEKYRQQGELIGWIEHDMLYFLPESTYAIAQKLASDGKQPLAFSRMTVHRRLRDKGYLHKAGNTGRRSLTAKKRINGAQIDVLWIPLDVFSGDAQGSLFEHVSPSDFDGDENPFE